LDLGRWLFLVWLGGRMARNLHSELLKIVVNAPVNLFFDITPIGKLIGNFTSDIGKTDRAFFHSINWVAHSVSDCCLKIGFALYFSPYMVFPIIFNIAWLYHV
jgi:hypothetical protein